ncbi:E3 ubiquitin-protein ligase Zswim2-like [Patiria miniata]|uniref:E3 ubiquitin-protein ligase ZSWIM2-like n=1 Tax=Patiria miniata TaxID=46514 RepID=A0A914BME1_PATMI|nr:E3 ubiquitin-protein ligase Zswim2-like [Patiria miniata]
MARSVAWRRTISDAASWHQDQAQSATIYILRETGPTGFLLKEEGETKKVKVFLGDPHSCTCSVFKKERDLCKHICWVLLKKFRVPRENPISFQLGLVEREINEILRGINNPSRQRSLVPRQRTVSHSKPPQGTSSSAGGRDVLIQREITADDVCPICQDELLNAREAVTYCRYGCAKSIHIKCMKVWAEHQRSVGETLVRCPLCREDFGQLEQLQAEYRNASLQKTRSERLDVHSGACCHHCNKSPIQGKCYRCTECFDYCLCHACFLTNIHNEHSFKFRQKMNQRWRPAQRGSGTALPQAVMDDLLARDISDGDYDLLLQLDSQSANQPSNIPEKVIKSFATETVRQGSTLLNPGVQCRVCLRGYSIGQVLRRLPCRHKFHTSCIDPWLLHQHPTCPVDGSIVWSPSTAQQTSSTNQNQRNKQPANGKAASEGALEIPGIGVASVRIERSGDAVAKGRHRGRSGVVERAPNGDIQGLTADFALTGLGIVSQSQTQSMAANSREGARVQPRRNSSRAPRTHTDTNIEINGVSDMAINLDAINATASANNDSGLLQDFQLDRRSSELRQDQLVEPSTQLPNRTGSSSSEHIPCLQPATDTRMENSQVPVQVRLETLTLPGTTTQGTKQHPSRGMARHRKPPLPTQPLVDRSSAPSIPLLRESVMTPIGNSRQQSTSAPSLGQRTAPFGVEGSSSGRPPLPAGGSSPGSVRDRGREPVRNVRSTQLTRKTRSTSVERSRSRDRLHPPTADKQQVLEGLLLGSSATRQVPSGKGQRSSPLRSSPLRSRVSQLHSGGQAERDQQLTEGISGSGLSSHGQ